MTCGALSPSMAGTYDPSPCTLVSGHAGRCMTKWGDHFDREPMLFSADWLCVIYQSWGARCGHSKCERTAQASYAERRRLMERTLLAKVDPAEEARLSVAREKATLRRMITMQRFRRYG